MKPFRNHIYFMTVTALCVFIAAGQVQAACTPQHTFGANGALKNSKPDSIYTDNGDGTVTDNQTGLMWGKCAMPMQYSLQSGASKKTCNSSSSEYNSWANAMNAVDNANTNNHFGYDDWRLPNIKELASLADLACNGSSFGGTGALNMDFFDLTTIKFVNGFPEPQYPSYLWSSSTNINVSSQVRMLSVYNGATVLRNKSGIGAAVMLVRDAD